MTNNEANELRLGEPVVIRYLGGKEVFGVTGIVWNVQKSTPSLKAIITVESDCLSGGSGVFDAEEIERIDQIRDQQRTVFDAPSMAFNREKTAQTILAAISHINLPPCNDCDQECGFICPLCGLLTAAGDLARDTLYGIRNELRN